MVGRSSPKVGFPVNVHKNCRFHKIRLHFDFRIFKNGSSFVGLIREGWRDVKNPAMFQNH